MVIFQPELQPHEYWVSTRVKMVLSSCAVAIAALIATPSIADPYKCIYEADPRERIRQCTLAINRGAFWSYPGPAEDYFYRAGAYFEIGNYVSAIADYSAAIGLGFDGDFAYLNRGIAYQNVGDMLRANLDFDHAVERSSRALETDGANISARFNRALALINLNQQVRALSDLDAVQQLVEGSGDESDLIDIYSVRARTHCTLGNVERSLSDYLKALDLQPDFAMGWLVFLKARGLYRGPTDAEFGTAAWTALEKWIGTGCPDG